MLAVVKRPDYTLFSLTYLASSNFRDFQKSSRKFYETNLTNFVLTIDSSTKCGALQIFFQQE